ncbi:uncharacterized protein VP01_11400g1, partial [Puccinia sorghi]
PDLKPSEEKQLTFGQLLWPENIQPNTFTEVAAFESFFEDKTIDLDDADYCRSPLHARLKEISNKHPTDYSMVDVLFYHRNRILVPYKNE